MVRLRKTRLTQVDESITRKGEHVYIDVRKCFGFLFAYSATSCTFSSDFATGFKRMAYRIVSFFVPSFYSVDIGFLNYVAPLPLQELTNRYKFKEPTLWKCLDCLSYKGHPLAQTTTYYHMPNHLAFLFYLQKIRQCRRSQTLLLFQDLGHADCI